MGKTALQFWHLLVIVILAAMLGTALGDIAGKAFPESAAGRALSGLLFGVDAGDVKIFAAAASVLAIAALLAGVVSALRATRVTGADALGHR